MAKITDFKLDFSAGGKETEESLDIKVSNFKSGESDAFFREFLMENGYSKDIGFKDVRISEKLTVRYITLFGYLIKTHFAIWRAEKDTKRGKAVYWIGDRNIIARKEDYVVDNRVIRVDALWHCVIVVPKTFKVGMSKKELKFVDILLIPINDLIHAVETSKQLYIEIRKEHREKYLFTNQIDNLIRGEQCLRQSQDE